MMIPFRCLRAPIPSWTSVLVLVLVLILMLVLVRVFVFGRSKVRSVQSVCGCGPQHRKEHWGLLPTASFSLITLDAEGRHDQPVLAVGSHYQGGSCNLHHLSRNTQSLRF